MTAFMITTRPNAVIVFFRNVLNEFKTLIDLPLGVAIAASFRSTMDRNNLTIVVIARLLKGSKPVMTPLALGFDLLRA